MRKLKNVEIAKYIFEEMEKKEKTYEIDFNKILNMVDDSIAYDEDFEKEENGDNCVVLINGDEATVKKVYKGTTGIELKAINPYYPPRIFTKEEIKDLPVKVIGVVEKSIRNFKKNKK